MSSIPPLLEVDRLNVRFSTPEGEVAAVNELSFTLAAGQSLGIVGISILIAVGVSLETVKQIDGQLMMRNYEGFLGGK